MKKISFLIAIFCISLSASIQAQTFKFGHVDSQLLLSVMPERDSAQAKLQKEAKNYDEQAQIMQAELSKKYESYLQKADSLSQLLRKNAEDEIRDMQERLQNFNGNAQQELKKKEGELLQPIFTRITNSIKQVAEEQKFTYIFDVNTFLYHSEQSIDVMEAVIDKLYSDANQRKLIKDKAKTAKAQQQQPQQTKTK